MGKIINQLKSIKDLIPFVYILLVLIGYFNLFVYYQKFDIEIIEFLTIPELIFAFIPIGSQGIFMLIIFSVFLISVGIFAKAGNSEETELSNDEDEKFIEKFTTSKTYKVIDNIFDSIIVLIVVFELLWFLLKEVALWKYDYNIALKIMMFWGVIVILKFLFKYQKSNNVMSFLGIFISVAILLGYLSNINNEINKANDILKGKQFKNITFTINNQFINTDSTNLYIGQTKEYIFIRNIVKNENAIYNKKEINTIRIK